MGHDGAESYTSHGSVGYYTYNTETLCSSGCEWNWIGVFGSNGHENCDAHSENPYATIVCYCYY